MTLAITTSDYTLRMSTPLTFRALAACYRQKIRSRWKGALLLMFLLCCAMPVSAQSSRLELPVSISLSDVKARINAAIPQTLINNPPTRHVCVPAKWLITKIPEFRGLKIYSKEVKTKISPEISCDVSSRVTRAGPLQIRSEGNSLLSTVTLNGTATVRGRGEIGKHIRETASGTLRITLQLTPAINNDWVVTGDPQISWTWIKRPQAKLFNLFTVTFTTEADRELNSMRPRIISDINNKLSELPLRREVETQWRSIQQPVAISTEENLYLSIRPQRAGLSDLRAVGDRLSVTVMLEADTRITTGRPAVRKPIALSRPVRFAVRPVGLNLSVPVSADFATLADRLAAVLELPAEHEIRTPIGTISTISIEKPQIRSASGSQLVVTVEAQIAGSDGRSVPLQIKLNARPDINEQARQLTLSLPSSALRVGDNEQSSLLYNLLFRSLAAKLEEQFIFDYEGEWQRLSRSLGELQTIDLNPQMQLRTRFSTPTHGRFQISSDSISVLAEVRGRAELVIRP